MQVSFKIIHHSLPEMCYFIEFQDAKLTKIENFHKRVTADIIISLKGDEIE